MTTDKPWPTVQDVANFLQVPLTAFTPTQQILLGQSLDAAIDDARRVPEWATVDVIPPRVWQATVGLAALEYGQGNPGPRQDGSVDVLPAPNLRWQYRMDMGHGRGGRARLR